jgi:hypothetical protein
MNNGNLKLTKYHTINMLQTKVNETLEKNIKASDTTNQQKINNNLEFYYINLGKIRINI